MRKISVVGWIVIGLAQLVSGRACGQVTASDPQMAAVQRVLQNEQVYCGPANGFRDSATEAGIRRFQMLHGLRVTGHPDGSTLEAMRLPCYTPGPAVESDQNLLQQMSQNPFPDPIGESSSTEAKKEGRPLMSRRDRVAARLSLGVSTEAIRRFLESFLVAASDADPLRELSFFGENVRYFEREQVNRNTLSDFLRRSRTQWPQRRFELLDVEPVAPGAAQSVKARFTLRFANANGNRLSRGIEKEEAEIILTEEGVLRLAGLRKVL